jgi:CHAT domain-containing protein
LGVDPRRAVLSGVSLTLEAVEQRLVHPIHVVAFATHGLLWKEAQKAMGMSEPSLLLSKTPGEGTGSKWLTTSIITPLNMDADLVILSACNSAASGVEDPDALSGLSSSFFEAGARGVMVSNWAIDATKTRELLREFAIQLKGSPAKSMPSVLREAMLSRMKADPNPRDWAIFIYVGR